MCVSQIDYVLLQVKLNRTNKLLTTQGVSFYFIVLKSGRMAQLVRAPRSHRGDRWFESSCAHFFLQLTGIDDKAVTQPGQFHPVIRAGATPGSYT